MVGNHLYRFYNNKRMNLKQMKITFSNLIKHNNEKNNLSLHTTLDGFVAGANGEMDWIKIDDEMFDLVGEPTNEADIALYGDVTY